jgi:hypothetical protein
LIDKLEDRANVTQWWPIELEQFGGEDVAVDVRSLESDVPVLVAHFVPQARQPMG